MQNDKKQNLMTQLNSETAKMPWTEMQKFYASGSVVFVDGSLDLIDTAAEIALDNKDALTTWMGETRVKLVNDDMAAQWLADNITVWTCVVAPFVLVQPVK